MTGRHTDSAGAPKHSGCARCDSSVFFSTSINGRTLLFHHGSALFYILPFQVRNGLLLFFSVKNDDGIPSATKPSMGHVVEQNTAQDSCWSSCTLTGDSDTYSSDGITALCSLLISPGCLQRHAHIPSRRNSFGNQHEKCLSCNLFASESEILR